jgi:glycosyltransferase involved in cell wall biosynthesis
MKEQPLVSICIPTYNRAGMINKAIESALGQSYWNLEVIVVDNASVDNTAEVVASFHDERLTYVKNTVNVGLFGNFNRCIELSTGKYLHILHSDDYLDPTFTAVCVAFFQDHPTVVMTSTSSRIVRDGDEQECTHRYPDHVYAAPEGFRRLLSARSFIACPSVMVRRDIYQDVGSFSLEYPYSSDFLQWLRIAKRYDVGFVSGACVFYRQGEHSETFRLLFSSPQGYLDMLKIFVQLRLEMGDGLDLFAADLLAAQRRYIHDCLYAGFTRGDSMPGFSSSVFTGFCLACWTLEKPVSVSQWFGKLRDLAIISSAGLLLCWSPARRMIRTLFFSGRNGY